MKALIRLETAQALRDRKRLFFSLVYPSVLLLLISNTTDTTSIIRGTHLTMPLFYTVAMAAFGALTAVLLGPGERLAKERENGTLPGPGQVLARAAGAAVPALPAVLVVLTVAAYVQGVTLDGGQWIALTAVSWAGSLVFAALGVAIGCLAGGNAVRPVTMATYLGLSVLGGLWLPVTVFPQWLQDVVRWLPTHAYAALGQAIELGGAPRLLDVAVLGGYLVLFGGVAGWACRG